MKTAEEKAQAYADSVHNEYYHDPFNEVHLERMVDECREAFVVGYKEAIRDVKMRKKRKRDGNQFAYRKGATEALAGQWRKEDDTEGLQDGERVIVAIQRIDNSIKYFYAAYFHNGKFWEDSDDSEIYSCNLWMRLPEPPKDEIR